MDAPICASSSGKMRALRDVYTTLAEDARQEAVSPAAESLLDNFHINFPGTRRDATRHGCSRSDLRHLWPVIALSN
jgi:hypothetical protein